jgi:hypothetical protein
MAKDKKIGTDENGNELIAPTDEHYETVKNIVKVHGDYLLEQVGKSVAVLSSRIEISESMGEPKEVLYYTGALEQTKVYIDMIIESVREVEKWCGIKKVYIKEEGVKKKRIKRIPVTNKKRWKK